MDVHCVVQLKRYLVYVVLYKPAGEALVVGFEARVVINTVLLFFRHFHLERFDDGVAVIRACWESLDCAEN